MTPIEPAGVAGSIREAWADSARRHGDRTAVTAGDRSLTYAELDRAADALAGGIRAGAGSTHRRIAILLDRSADLVVATVAVVKAGATYVPLDPAVPSARLAAVVAAARPALVVTSRRLRGRVPDDVPVLCVDEPVPTIGPADEASECAYVIFTSGTTGRSKGVQISHANVLSLFRATDAVLGTGPADVWSMFHSYAFDFSVWEMWGPLLHGGRLVVVPEAISRDPARFRCLLRDEGVTVLSQTPTAFMLLVDEDRRHPDRLPVRRVILGGEALRFGDLRPWVAKYGDRMPELINMYGITETTVHTTYRRVTATDVGEPASLIGRPLPGTDIRLLDEDLAAVPPGATGEIVVVGPGVGLGYLDLPELTRDRFVDLPGTGRGYRSGDLARRRPDGDLEYLGRADDQVKVRGFRIELGDVEAALAGHPAVRAAAVALRRTAAGEDGLAGYVVGEGAPGERDLRAYLAEVLPDHMVPASITRLTALPMTPNGKLDRAALPDPVVRGGTGGRTPRSLREELVCRLFEQVLGRTAVAPEDDFFELGAHSLSAVQLINRIRAVLGAEVSLPDLFRARTAAAVARLTTPGPPLVRNDRVQREIWAGHRSRGPARADLIRCAWTLTGEVDIGALRAALGDVVRRHEVLRTAYPDRGGTPDRHVLPPDTAPVLLVERDGPGGIDITTELPLRVRLTSLGARESLLVLEVHRIAVDDWSLGPLLSDLSTAYAARHRGTAPRWSPVPVQPAPWSGAPVEPDRPCVGAGGPVERVRIPLDAGLRSRLAELARVSVTTDGIVLHAGVAALLTRAGAGADLPIGVVTSGRTGETPDHAVGPFAAALLTRVDTSGDTTFATLLQRVRASTVAAHDQTDLPPTGVFARPRVTVGARPERPSLDLAGLVVRAEPVEEHTAGAELSFWIEERDADIVIEYRTDAYAQEDVRDLGERLVALLAVAVDAVGTPLHQLHGAPPPDVPAPPHPSTAGPDGPLADRTRHAVAAALDMRPGSVDGGFLQLLSGDDAFAAVVPLRPAGEWAPLFCIHPGSGLCWSYVGLPAHLPPEVPVHGIQARGLSDPDGTPTSVEEMAADYVTRIRAVRPEGPYQLLGWSFGGVVALEIATQLRAAAAEVSLLALLDCSPRLPAQSAEEPAEAVELVRRDLPAGRARSRLEALLRTASHHRRLFAAHVPSRFDGDVLFFRADGEGGPKAADWADLVSGEIDEHAVPATHTAMLDPAPLRQIGPVLAAAIRRSGSAGR